MAVDARSLTSTAENQLAGKLVWIFGAPRTGSTWLATQLLQHENNLIWEEPYIGAVIHSIRLIRNMRSGGNAAERSDDGYFFCDRYKNDCWLPLLRKMILSRVACQFSTPHANIIIKEPNGSGGCDVVMESVPEARLIFLLRDGRDVVDSLIDAHRDDSWNPSFPPLVGSDSRQQAITRYSHLWKELTDTVDQAYQNHEPGLRHLVKYEALRSRTVEELKKIYEFLGLDATDEDLIAKAEKHDFGRIPESQKGPGHFTRSAAPGGWRTNFNLEEQQLMDSVMSETLEKVGYARGAIWQVGWGSNPR